MNDIVTIDPTSIDSGVMDRANEVQKQLLAVTNKLGQGFLRMCDLLLEAHDGSYHTCYGFGRFGDWVESEKELDISARSAHYYVNIGKKVKQMGLSREQIAKVRISSLKKIMELEPLENGNDIKRLVAAAPDMTLEEVTAEVRKIRVSAGKPDRRKIGPYFVEPRVEETIDEAYELARKNYGSTIKDGEITDIGDGKCLELIAVNYLQDPNNYDEREFGAEHTIEEANPIDV